MLVKPIRWGVVLQRGQSGFLRSLHWPLPLAVVGKRHVAMSEIGISTGRRLPSLWTSATGPTVPRLSTGYLDLSTADATTETPAELGHVVALESQLVFMGGSGVSTSVGATGREAPCAPEPTARRLDAAGAARRIIS
jgi:hypothetical protein